MSSSHINHSVSGYAAGGSSYGDPRIRELSLSLWHIIRGYHLSKR